MQSRKEKVAIGRKEEIHEAENAGSQSQEDTISVEEKGAKA